MFQKCFELTVVSAHPWVETRRYKWSWTGSLSRYFGQCYWKRQALHLSTFHDRQSGLPAALPQLWAFLTASLFVPGQAWVWWEWTRSRRCSGLYLTWGVPQVSLSQAAQTQVTSATLPACEGKRCERKSEGTVVMEEDRTMCFMVVWY